MIKYQYRLLVVAVTFFISSLSYADVSDESLDRLLDLSGLTMQVDQFPGLIKAGMQQTRQQGARIPDAEYNLMLAKVDESILPSEILEGIRISLKNAIKEEDAKKLLAWYESDLGQEITRAEESATTPQAYQEMMQSAQSLLENRERVAFANRLDILLGATDMTTDALEHSGIAVYTAFMAAMQPEASLNIESFKAQMDEGRAQRRAEAQQMVIVSYVYSYRNIDTEKLKKYEAFLKDETTRKFNKTVIESLSRELQTAVSKWADMLASFFRSRKQQG